MKKLAILLFTALTTFIFTPTTAQNYESIDKNKAFYSLARIYNIYDAGVNTSYFEMGHTFYKNKFIIISNRKVGLISPKDKNTNQPYTRIFCIDVDNKGNLERPLLFSKNLNTNKYHEGSIVFSRNERTVFFTRTDDQNNFILHQANLSEKRIGRWEDIKVSHISKEHPNITDLYINPEGTLLYFASNAPTGYGGYDLYAAEIKEDGSLHMPLNLGPIINSSGNEHSPFLTKNSSHLYFSSDGHATYGKLDIFKSRIVHHSYGKPINLGPEINSPANDLGFILASKRLGYFTSNRDGGHGNYDIYKFTKNPVEQKLSGYVVDRESQSELPHTKLILRNATGTVVQTTSTDRNGFYQFNDISPLEHYEIGIDKKGYFASNLPFHSNKNFSYAYREDIELILHQPELVEIENDLVIQFDNILFDYNKARLQKASKIPLDQVVKTLEDYPDYNVIIKAHTDTQGHKAYNQKLSKRRANITMKYLIENGIHPDRVTAKGMGESQPLIDCRDQCSESEHQKNRRVEFILKQQ